MNEIINKTDGTILKWSRTPNNDYFCLLYSDNKNNYSFTPTTNLNCKLFMIGGGGAGGYYFGGGGGAGAAYYNENFTFKKGITYNFSIGNGGKCDIDDFNSLFSQGLSLNIYNNVNIDFTNISFTLDDYSSLNINNSGLVQNFIVNTYNTNINIPNSIWNNNTVYIWSGYVIPNINSEYITININTNINTAIWFDNYIYKNDNALILNTNNNYLNDVKIIKIDPKRYYNIKIIAYCNNNSTNNNFNVSFNDKCSVSLNDNCSGSISLCNYNKNNEKYIYLNATDTTLNFNDPSLNNPINNLICSGGGNGGCGFFNQNNNLDGGCGGGSGINKKNGKTIVNTSIYKGTNGAIGTFCGGGGGIQSDGKDNMGGDGIILNWFDNELTFGCGGNGGNTKDNKNRGYGCGGNGGDCCYYSKEIINNNGKNGCVLIYINPSQPQPEIKPIIETFANNNEDDIIINDVENYYNYVVDTKKELTITQIYMNSISTITDIKNNNNMYGFSTTTSIYDIRKPVNNTSTTYAGYFKKNNTSFPTSNAKGTYDLNDVVDGKDIFFNYFKYNPIYIYDILCFHKCLIGLYKIVSYQIGKDPYDDNYYNNLRITLNDNAANSQYSSNNITLANIFNIKPNCFEVTETIKNTELVDDKLYKESEQYTKYFYGNLSPEQSDKSLKITNDCFKYKYTNDTDKSTYPILPYYNTYDNTNKELKSLTYIMDYLNNDFINKFNIGGTGKDRGTDFRTNNFINNISELRTGITLANVKNAIEAISTAKNSYNNDSLHDNEMKLLYLDVFRNVLDPDLKSKICGRLYFYSHLFNLIIINLNLQYGLYRHIFSRLGLRPYIFHKNNNNISDTTKTTYYFTKLGQLTTNRNHVVAASTIPVSIYTDDIKYSKEILAKVYYLFRNFKIRDINNSVYNVDIENNDASKTVMEAQLKLNKIIKKYNDELQIYNTTLNLYKAIIVISIILLIVILYILNTSALSKSSKISLFIILGALIFGICVYFVYNNVLLYENFTDNNDENDGKKYKTTDIIESFIPVDGNGNNDIMNGVNIIKDCHTYNAQTPMHLTKYDDFGNAHNNFTNYDKNPQGLITNFIYLAGLINPNIVNNQDTREDVLNFSSDITFNSYNKACGDHYSFLRYYIASTYNIMNNSKNAAYSIASIIKYKRNRENFYKNRYDYYVNAIETLNNNKYIYYYLSILFALCIVLLLFSLIIILLLGTSFESILITSILSFLILIIIIYYIYFKLHQRTRMKINKNYWAYNNPSDKTFSENNKI